MKRLSIFLTLLILGSPFAAFAATLQNTDSQPYELQILESGQPYPRQFRLIENSKVEFCFYGCQVTLLATGQTVQVNPKDSVVIDSGVISVTSGD